MRDDSSFRLSPAARLVSLLILSAPPALLGWAAVRLDSQPLLIGGLFAGLGAVLFLRPAAVWRPPTGGSVVMLYVMAAAWAWGTTAESDDPAARAARGGLLAGAVALLAVHDLLRSGAEPRRRAARWCHALQGRVHWPEDVVAIATLPEVRGLRAASRADPGPAFKLLGDPRPGVRAAGIAALAGRPHWEPNEAFVVLEAAQKTADPAVRAAAITALAHATDPITMDRLAGFLRDPDPEVRTAAARTALTGGGDKWVLVRNAVRAALADPRLLRDGPLPGAAGWLSPAAVCDLTAWAAEADPLSERATRTLVGYYAARLQTANDYDLPLDLSHQVVDKTTPTGLRVELAHLLRQFHLLTPELLDRMTNADQPGLVRLLAAEALLDMDPNHPDGIDVLRGLGRQPNREMALAIARVVQRHLGVDVGLPADQSVEAQSRVAGDVARRVLAWATSKGSGAGASTPGVPTPGFPASSPPPAGYGRRPANDFSKRVF